MINKFLNALMVAGISLCLLCIVYAVYIAGAKWAVAKIEAADAKGMVIARFFSVTEGEVIRADETGTVIEYYYEWDGANYKTVLHHANPDYPKGAKATVVYSVGMAMGSCLVVGFYRRYMLVCGIIGMVLFISGMILRGRKICLKI